MNQNLTALSDKIKVLRDMLALSDEFTEFYSKRSLEQSKKARCLRECGIDGDDGDARWAERCAADDKDKAARCREASDALRFALDILDKL